MKNKIIIIGGVVLLLLLGLFFIMRDSGPVDPYDDGMTLKKAAKIGEKVTHKLLVQIEASRGEGRYDRGDVVLTASSSKQFSPAEKSGFLIIKMDLTPTQAEILTRSLDKVSKELDPDGMPIRETLKRRKYAVDLDKIGIADDDFKGRELNEIYKWDILFEKKAK